MLFRSVQYGDLAKFCDIKADAYPDGHPLRDFWDDEHRRALFLADEARVMARQHRRQPLPGPWQ